MDRVAIITGGSRGIGQSFAEALLAEGYRVTLTAARDGDALRHTVEALAARFGASRVLGVQADASVPEDAARVVADTVARFGRLDILINNAGRGLREISETFHQDPPKFWQAAPDGWDSILRSNVMGPFLMARAAVPHMIARGWGRVVGISTSRVTMVKAGFAPYGPSKAALDTMTANFAADLAGTGVTANILLPGGPTETDFIPPSGRTGRYRDLLPVDVMNAALLWLLSEAADEVTAARINGSKWDPEDISAAREDTGQPPLIL